MTLLRGFEPLYFENEISFYGTDVRTENEIINSQVKCETCDLSDWTVVKVGPTEFDAYCQCCGRTTKLKVNRR